MRSTMRIGSHPIHPMLIPFPFALWTTSVLADLYAAVRDQFHYIGYWLAVAGCAGAVLAAIPGLVDYFTIIPQGTRAKRTGLWHGALNIMALAFFIISITARPDPAFMNYWAYLASGLGLLLIAVSGWLGGSLVYDHKVGVPDVELDAGAAGTATTAGARR
ncbi:MAG: DUF2231 domain-containing protein [Gemmatimonadaceae bacterium]